ncbi:MAG: transaldolase [Deltaproteobacteria bacterium]|nr:transaldolase [Deltaproteobacteria bacterium]
MPKSSNILALNELGQSIWYDNLSRNVLNTGELAQIIQSGVSGLTSNPTIFKKAIADTSDYDSDLLPRAKKGMSTADICEDLMVADVGAAADLLLPVYRQTDGADGYASIEVSPFLAHDTKGTLEAAKRLWSRLNRPNIMIKIPATEEGLAAIRSTLELGINVNVTLIFSAAMYERVADAYISALESRQAKSADIKNIASVASFFVSRVDTICEKTFDAMVKAGTAKESDKPSFRAKIGVANSKVAYESYEKIFAADRFKKLKQRGARVQRPLWASTGTKSADLSPVLYVEELAGRDTVNTVPPQTLHALIEKMKVAPRLHEGLAEAKKLVAHVNALGLPFDKLLLDLQAEGVKLFSESFQELLDSIEKKRKALV